MPESLSHNSVRSARTSKCAVTHRSVSAIPPFHSPAVPPLILVQVARSTAIDDHTGEKRKEKCDASCSEILTMPSFFDFQQGSEGNSRPGNDTAPLLGRFRAVPGRRNSVGDILFGRGSLGYGSIFGGLGEEGVEGVSFWGHLKDIWITPTQEAVRGAIDRWWDRWCVLVILPALLVCCLLFVSEMAWEIGRS